MEKGYGFVDRMILMVKEAKRQKTPKKVVLTILLSALVRVMLFKSRGTSG
jgi:high-affinity K+ transport system ATPase subunit B